LNNHRRTVTAVNTIFHDSQHPSHIALPIIPVPLRTGQGPNPGVSLEGTRLANFNLPKVRMSRVQEIVIFDMAWRNGCARNP
jgi:hypothetical protein